MVCPLLLTLSSSSSVPHPPVSPLQSIICEEVSGELLLLGVYIDHVFCSGDRGSAHDEAAAGRWAPFRVRGSSPGCLMSLEPWLWSVWSSCYTSCGLWTEHSSTRESPPKALTMAASSPPRPPRPCPSWEGPYITIYPSLNHIPLSSPAV